MNADDILNGPDYFRCEKWHAKLRKEVCVKRQSLDWSIPINAQFEYCRDCEQGKQIILERGTEVAQKAKEPFPSKVCVKCGEEKPIYEFYRHPAARDRREGTCKECKKKLDKERHKKKSKKQGGSMSEEKKELNQNQEPKSTGNYLDQRWKEIASILTVVEAKNIPVAETFFKMGFMEGQQSKEDVNGI